MLTWLATWLVLSGGTILPRGDATSCPGDCDFFAAGPDCSVARQFPPEGRLHSAFNDDDDDDKDDDGEPDEKAFDSRKNTTHITLEDISARFIFTRAPEQALPLPSQPPQDFLYVLRQLRI